MGPLAGIKILDLTTVVMGPYATQVLGDLGADVVKVEAPEGDMLRHVPPGHSPDMGGMFITGNRSKRSIVLNLKSAGGRKAFLRLAAKSDVLVTNIRSKALGRLDLGYDAVAKANQEIVYVGLTGYGPHGPYSDWPAYDDLIQGASGLPALGAFASGQRPTYAPLALSDRVVGLHAAIAILSALLHRDRTGQGQQVNVPMFETMAGFVLADHLSGLVFDPPLDDGGYGRLLALDRRPFETLDGYICALIYTDKHWRRFFELVGQPEMLNDARFANHGERTRHIRAIYAEVADILRTRNTAEWLTLLKQADIPCSPVNGISDLLVDPHLEKVGFFQMVDHPTEGRIRTMRVPTAWSKTPPVPPCEAPKLGEHGQAVLREAGCTDEEIGGWLAEGALMLPQETFDAFRDDPAAGCAINLAL